MKADILALGWYFLQTIANIAFMCFFEWHRYCPMMVGKLPSQYLHL